MSFLRILFDPLTPSSAEDYLARLDAIRAELDQADKDLCHAWDDRSSARWNGGSCVEDMRPADHPLVLAAEARIDAARARWLLARDQLAAFLAQPLELRCSVRNWKRGCRHEVCLQSAGHLGKHDFELASVVQADDQAGGPTP